MPPRSFDFDFEHDHYHRCPHHYDHQQGCDDHIIFSRRSRRHLLGIGLGMGPVRWNWLDRLDLLLYSRIYLHLRQRLVLPVLGRNARRVDLKFVFVGCGDYHNFGSTRHYFGTRYRRTQLQR